MGALVSRTKAPFTAALPLWWEIVATCSGGREREAAAAAGRREEGFRRMSVDLQVQPWSRVNAVPVSAGGQFTAIQCGTLLVRGPSFVR